MQSCACGTCTHHLWSLQQAGTPRFRSRRQSADSVPGSHTSDTKLKAKLTRVATGRRSGAVDDAESDILEVASAQSSMLAPPTLSRSTAKLGRVFEEPHDVQPPADCGAGFASCFRVMYQQGISFDCVLNTGGRPEGYGGRATGQALVARRLGAAHVHLGADPRQRLPAGDRHRARRLLPWQGTRQSRVLSAFLDFIGAVRVFIMTNLPLPQEARQSGMVSEVCHKRSGLVWQRSCS